MSRLARKQTRSDKYAGGFPPGMEAFQNLSDPRTGKAKRHYFGEVMLIALAAMICGMEGFDDFERFAKLKESWLRRFLKLPHGTPSDDTFRRIFTALEPKTFVECFSTHVRGRSRQARRSGTSSLGHREPLPLGFWT